MTYKWKENDRYNTWRVLISSMLNVNFHKHGRYIFLYYSGCVKIRFSIYGVS